MNRTEVSTTFRTRWTMIEPFHAIGLRVTDQATYESLAEAAHQRGELSLARREQGVMHGCCWSLGDGLEVWTVLYETRGGKFYADCRPAFRGRQLFHLFPWEIVEYEEGGEAWARGITADGDVSVAFALQNITEIDPRQFRDQPLIAAVSGLAYRAQINKRAGKPVFEPLGRRYPRRDTADNDYAVRGTVLSWRDLTNSLTRCNVVWVEVETGSARLEVLLNRDALKGELKRGAWLSAEVWLQGHVLRAQDVRSRYEGVDFSTPRRTWWKKLRRYH